MQPHLATKYCEAPETVAAKLRSCIEGINVEVNGDGDNLWIAAIFPAPNYVRALGRVRSTLFNGLDFDDFPEVHLQWAPNATSWAVARIRDAVVDALPLRPNGHDLSHIIHVRLQGFALEIHVDTAGLFGVDRAQYARARESWSRKVAALDLKLPEGVTQVLIRIGDPIEDWAPSAFASVDSDDDDNGNPNWPSKTGNASGKGRGNNPPRR
ncbi:MAG: hypothetical protein ACREO4_12680 [Lysobacter sp.]